MGRIRNAAAYTAMATGSAAAWLVRTAANIVYSPTVQAKAEQGATELSNALFTGHGYSPYTADNAARRAQFQNRDQSKGIDR
jgi:hypothetical protein